MGRVDLTTDELQEIISAASKRGAEEAVNQIFELFGVKNDDEGRDAMRSFGKIAMRVSKYCTELEDVTIKGAAKWTWRLVWFAIFGAIAFVLIRTGIIPAYVPK